MPAIAINMAGIVLIRATTTDSSGWIATSANIQTEDKPYSGIVRME